MNGGIFIHQSDVAGNVLGNLQGTGPFDQAAEDGNGLLIVASNNGSLESAECASTGNFGSATFVK